MHRPVKDYRSPSRTDRATALPPGKGTALLAIRTVPEDAASQTSSRTRLGARPIVVMPTVTDLRSARRGAPLRITPRRSDLRSVGAQVVGGHCRRCRRWRSLRDRRAVAALVEGTLLHHRTLHATTATGAGRARSGTIGGSVTAAATGRRAAATRRRIATAAAATVEQSAATTAGGHQKRESDGEEREAFHRNGPFRKGS
jgi:hypothetical protein